MSARVLYVDDDAPNLIVFEAACAGEFDVVTAESAAEALRIMREEEVAVLLTDQRMPETTGVELAATTRDEFPDTIRMLVTGYADLDSTIDAINWGQVHKYMKKPWDIRELKATLIEACELYRMNKEISSLRRKLGETERVYAMGIVAASIGRELGRPFGRLTEGMQMATSSIEKAVTALAASDLRTGKLAVETAHSELSSAQFFATRMGELLRGMELPLKEQQGVREKVLLGDVIRLTLHAVRGEFRGRAQLKLDVKPVAPVWGTTTALGQVVLNLFVSALEAFPSPRESGIISAKGPVEYYVTVRTAEENGAVVVEIEDNGTPASAADLNRMFDPFSGSGETQAGRLGLAICRRIVEDLGGKLEASNPERGGTRVRISLPIAA